MPRSRAPNEGPYIVSSRYKWATTGNAPWVEEECHTWKYACDRMRALMIEGKEVKVDFA